MRVHDPSTFPEVNSKGTVVEAGKEAFLTVSAVHTESSDSVRYGRCWSADSDQDMMINSPDTSYFYLHILLAVVCISGFCKAFELISKFT